ncbi:hypothetical protein LIER_26358 [Lithospermum erythrorhizon]|uniref:Retroviral polymerase SH3-like domain-containing protein n=1 Tax=Lithospermum erythrorhizon TaxID=34254 RepID=A0AAV3R9C9_LITER
MYFCRLPLWEKGWKLYDLESHTYFVSRDVIFYEDEFHTTISSHPITPVITVNDCASKCTETENLEVLGDANDTGEPVLVSEQQTEQPHEEQLPVLKSDLSNGAASAEQPSSMGVVGLASDSGNGVGVPELEMGRGKRAKIPSVRLQDNVINIVQKLSPTSVLASSSNSSSTPYPISHPISHSLNYDRFSIGHKNFLASITTDSEPKSFKEAIQHPSGERRCRKRSPH